MCVWKRERREKERKRECLGEYKNKLNIIMLKKISNKKKLDKINNNFNFTKNLLCVNALY